MTSVSILAKIRGRRGWLHNGHAISTGGYLRSNGEPRHMAVNWRRREKRALAKQVRALLRVSVLDAMEELAEAREIAEEALYGAHDQAELVKIQERDRLEADGWRAEYEASYWRWVEEFEMNDDHLDLDPDFERELEEDQEYLRR